LTSELATPYARHRNDDQRGCCRAYAQHRPVRAVGGISFAALGTAWLLVLTGLVLAITSGHVSPTFATSSDFNRFAAF
jgi:hypothetical protein